MTPFTQLPGARRAPPGIERRIFHRLPWLMAAGAVPLALSYLIPYLIPRMAGSASVIQFACAGIAITTFLATLVLGVGCAIVIVMKGPAYVRDAYRLRERD